MASSKKKRSTLSGNSKERRSLEETGLVNVETAAAIDAAIHKLVASGRNSTKG